MDKNFGDYIQALSAGETRADGSRNETIGEIILQSAMLVDSYLFVNL